MSSKKKRTLALGLVLILPVTAFAADAATKPIFVSNAKLDTHVIYQDFSFFQPYESVAYATLIKQAAELKRLGITDVWMAPPYRVAQAGFEEGYSVNDRYDLGEFPQGHNGTLPTKYGTAAELRRAIAKFHSLNMNAIADLVPNQLIGLSTREVSTVTAVDNYGTVLSGSAANVLYPAYTKGGGTGQSTYGLIKEWNAGYENGTSTQNLGLDRIMTDSAGTPYRFYGVGDSRNYEPDWVSSAFGQQYGNLNVIDTYFSVDGYYQLQTASGGLVYRPYLMYYVDSHPGATNQAYLAFMRTQGFAGKTDDDVRTAIINASDESVVAATNLYLAAQPGYSATSEAGISFFRFDRASPQDIGQNVLQYEFLSGTDVDNTNPDVQAEVLNWQKFLINKYGFDGFRFDAAGHYNNDVIRQSAAMMSTLYKGNMDNHLSILESYVDEQIGFENSNRNGQLTYNADLYNALAASLEQANPTTPLSDIVNKSISVAHTTITGTPLPNWSFVNNHDQESNVAGSIPLTAAQANGSVAGSNAWRLAEMSIYDADRRLALKQYTPYNIPAAYALILTNKNTVPTVYYGDLYDSDQPYATVKSPYYKIITDLLKVRQQYATGPQQTTYFKSNTSPNVAGQDLMASVRIGTSRLDGVAVVIGNDPTTSKTIQVKMGSAHASQTYVNAAAAKPVYAVTNASGVLSVPVVGSVTPLVHGYLGVWVPYS
jgi:glycosidase